MVPDDNDIIYNQYTPDFLGIIRRIYEGVSGSDASADGFIARILTLWDVYSILAFLLSLLFIIGIIYSYIRLGPVSYTHLRAHETRYTIAYAVFGL